MTSLAIESHCDGKKTASVSISGKLISTYAAAHPLRRCDIQRPNVCLALWVEAIKRQMHLYMANAAEGCPTPLILRSRTLIFSKKPFTTQSYMKSTRLMRDVHERFGFTTIHYFLKCVPNVMHTHRLVFPPHHSLSTSTSSSSTRCCCHSPSSSSPSRRR